jgi:hypothetical protein
LVVSSAMALSPDTGRRLRRKHQTRAASQGLLMEINSSL